MPHPSEKPIDRWLALASIAMGLILFLVPKTPATIVVCLVIILALLIHPLWNFWWIERNITRRISACLCFIFILVVFGYTIWPQPQKSTQASSPLPILTPTPIVPTSRTKPKTLNLQTSNKKFVHPDVTLRIVNPKSIATTIINTSHVVAREIVSDLIIWNLDLDRSNSLNIVGDEHNWLRAGEITRPIGLTFVKQNIPLLNPGNRLVGIASVSCPDCKRTKYYLIYTIHGQGGWFAEYPEGIYPNLTKGVKELSEIRNDPEKYFNDVPLSSRIPIKDFE